VVICSQFALQGTDNVVDTDGGLSGRSCGTLVNWEARRHDEIATKGVSGKYFGEGRRMTRGAAAGALPCEGTLPLRDSQPGGPLLYQPLGGVH